MNVLANGLMFVSNFRRQGTQSPPMRTRYWPRRHSQPCIWNVAWFSKVKDSPHCFPYHVDFRWWPLQFSYAFRTCVRRGGVFPLCTCCHLDFDTHCCKPSVIPSFRIPTRHAVQHYNATMEDETEIHFYFVNLIFDLIMAIGEYLVSSKRQTILMKIRQPIGH